jgi:L-seryl-tRNA(Ser) seleniumtransferase
MSADQLRQLPSVNDLLLQAQDLVAVEGHQRVVDALRQSLSAARASIRAGSPPPTFTDLLAATRDSLQSSVVRRPSSVINATGVIIHTNLGRAVLSVAAQQAMLAASSGYSPLEFDLDSGERGRRGQGVEQLLCQVSGAEDALVVNNCAAATVLMLSALARGRGVVISRGQLIEIGGGFRIPEILEQSGARLVEVGTTNRTRRADYERALRDHPDVAAILRAHSSNFRIVGFTESVGIEDLVELADDGRPMTEADRPSSVVRRPSIPVLDDLGSGALLDTAAFGLSHEPMVQESVRAGAAVVAFSGDKLLGGPQAGILVGRKDAIELCRRHPLARAFRADKFTLAGLGATVLHYLRGDAAREVPVWRMVALPCEEIQQRAERCVETLAGWSAARSIRAQIVSGESTVGGGSLPGETLPTVLIALCCEQPDALARQLRLAPTPVVARIREDRVLLDLRTVLDDGALITSLLSL